MPYLHAGNDLWRRIREAGMGCVSVMGLAKNTGKTVTLNHLLARAAADGLAVGLSSIGRDGEARDAVFNFPKPPVLVWPGTLVATARSTLARAVPSLRIVDATGITSPMGEIVIVRALEPGAMEVAGASRGADQRRLIDRLVCCGASQVFLDGALGRSQHATPALADGVVLATGAALGGSIADVLRKTRDRIRLLGIPQADAGVRAACGALFMSGGVALWRPEGDLLFEAAVPSLNAAPLLLEHAQGPVGMLACSGAVGQGLWQAFEVLAQRYPGLVLVVADGTRLFVEATDLNRLQARGASLVAMRPIHIAGITLNPFSPLGATFDPASFVEAAARALPEHAVTDVLWPPGPSSTGEETHGRIAA